MTYRVVLVPDESIGYPNCVFNLLFKYSQKSFIITHNKKVLYASFPNAYFIERTKKDEIIDKLILEQRVF